MKKISAFLVLSAFLVFLTGATIETAQYSFQAMRTANVTADSPGTALDGTTAGYTYAYASKSSLAMEVHSKWNNCQIYFVGTDAANETCNYKIYAYRANGPAVLVCSGVFTLGTAVTGNTNEFFADTITATTEVWPTDVTISDSGNNRICTLSFDLLGYKWVQVELDIPAASQVASANVYISGF